MGRPSEPSPGKKIGLLRAGVSVDRHDNEDCWCGRWHPWMDVCEKDSVKVNESTKKKTTARDVT